MNRHWQTILGAAVLVAVVAGCESQLAEPPPAPKPAPKPAPAVAPAPAPEAAVPAPASPAAMAAAPTECAGKVAPGAPETIKAGALVFERNGAFLTQKEPTGGKTAVLGVLANIKEAAPDNMVNLGKLVEWFQAEKAEGIIVAGDITDTKAGIEAVLRLLAKPGLPLYVIPGNWEPLPDYRAAMAAVQADTKHVFDLSMIRFVNLPGVDLVSVPGYYDKTYHHAPNGCLTGEGDVTALKEALAKADSKVMLVSHAGPRQSGEAALDHAVEGGNVGDPVIAQLVEQAKIPFGIGANINEAGYRGTDRTGKALVKEGEMVAELFVNPGPADSTAWTMNDGSTGAGMAVIVTVQGDKASWKGKRLLYKPPAGSKGGQ